MATATIVVRVDAGQGRLSGMYTARGRKLLPVPGTEATIAPALLDRLHCTYGGAELAATVSHSLAASRTVRTGVCEGCSHPLFCGAIERI